jgi:hypothetical protein
LAQPIGTEERATSTDRDYEIRLVDIRPLDRERTQTSIGAQIRDTIPAPVVAYRQEVKALSSQVWFAKIPSA